MLVKYSNNNGIIMCLSCRGGGDCTFWVVLTQVLEILTILEEGCKKGFQPLKGVAQKFNPVFGGGGYKIAGPKRFAFFPSKEIS